MHNKRFKVLSCIVFVTGVLSGLVGGSGMPSQSIQTEEKTIAPDVNVITAQYDTEGQNQEAEGQEGGTESEGIGADRVSLGEVETVNAAAFGNPKEVLDHMPITSEVEVKKTGEDEFLHFCCQSWKGICSAG